MKSAASTGDKMPDVEQDVDWSIDAVAYRQLIADRIQNIRFSTDHNKGGGIRSMIILDINVTNK